MTIKGNANLLYTKNITTSISVASDVGNCYFSTRAEAPAVLVIASSFFVATFADIAISSTLVCLALLLWLKRGNKHPLPPGPPADPFIGHFRKFPKHNTHKVFMEWARTYGRHSASWNRGADHTNDLLDGRSTVYSCRQQAMISKLIACPKSSKSAIWQRIPQAASFISPVPQSSNKRLVSTDPNPRGSYVNGFLDTGADNYEQHLTRFATSVVVRVAFGYNITTNDDPFLAILARFAKVLEIEGPSGITTLDALPFFHEYPIAVLKQHITKNTIEVFLLAMLLRPECQRRCQEELDRCVLRETLRWHPVVPMGLPHRSTEDDVYKGMFIPKHSRVFPISSTQVGMNRDESKYSDPETFHPSRFMPKSEGGGGETYYPVNFGKVNLISLLFSLIIDVPQMGTSWFNGVCSGRFLAENNTWIAMAMILATLNLKKAIGQDGKEIISKAEFSQSASVCVNWDVRRVKYLRFCLEPRSAKVEALCRREKE
ncbi:cytochrome P450 [Mycena floridula]|nr:cytochrome P450 [Mycena floridula]